MVYRHKESASFVSMERVVGRIGKRSGSFVLQGIGSYADGTAKCNWVVVPGSATGELSGLRGKGGYVAQSADYPNMPISLDYEFD